MKICYLANSSIPSTTANSIAIIKICEAFSQLKHDVSLITANVREENSHIFKFYDVKFKFNIKGINYFKKFPLGINYYLFSLISVFQSLKFKPDFYITRNFFTCFVLILFKKKVIIELHSDLKNESRVVKFLVKYTNYLKSKSIIKIILISNGLKKEYLKKKYIDKKKILLLPSGSAIKENFNFIIKKKSFKIGYFGSLHQSRGFDLIVKLSRIDKLNTYYIYGNLRQALKINFKNNSKNLIVNNHVPYKEIPKILNKMDILLMPYTSSITMSGNVGDMTNYTSPLKLFDYLCSGKIIICSNFPILKEVIKENKNAIFVKNFLNHYSWKNEIFKLRNQVSKQFIISKNNYLLSKKFNLSNRAKSILNSIV
jgi:glycosyltransferase involved in cell wall biosynthesis